MSKATSTSSRSSSDRCSDAPSSTYFASARCWPIERERQYGARAGGTMNDIDQQRAARKRFQVTYRALYDEVLKILFDFDPIGVHRQNTLEKFVPETASILPRLQDARSPDGVEQIIQEELRRWSGQRCLARQDPERLSSSHNSGSGNLTIDQLPAGEDAVLASGTLEYFERQGRPTESVNSDAALPPVWLSRPAGSWAARSIPAATSSGRSG